MPWSSGFEPEEPSAQPEAELKFLPEMTEKPLILIVDDNAHNLQVLGSILRDNGYRTAVAQDGQEALLFVHRKRPSLVLLDIMMPGMDGFEVCRHLGELSDGDPIPVIFLSVLSETSDKVKAFRCGGVDYITKPFQQEEVLARIAVHLQLQATQQALQRANEELEERVRMRTSALTEANAKLEEANIALKVLLERKDETRRQSEERLIFNVRHGIQPNLDKLQATGLDSDQRQYVMAIESQLQEVTSPLKRDLSQRYGLTPMEMQLVDLIKQGKLTKEIAHLLNLSKRTIDTHRQNIRKKLGLQNTDTNLRSFLLSLDHQEEEHPGPVPQHLS
jgi:DNA-binding response OmpR family regulator